MANMVCDWCEMELALATGNKVRWMQGWTGQDGDFWDTVPHTANETLHGWKHCHLYNSFELEKNKQESYEFLLYVDSIWILNTPGTSVGW